MRSLVTFIRNEKDVYYLYRPTIILEVTGYVKETFKIHIIIIPTCISGTNKHDSVLIPGFATGLPNSFQDDRVVKKFLSFSPQAKAGPTIDAHQPRSNICCPKD